MRNGFCAFLLILLLLGHLSTIAEAQIGEVAGNLVFNLTPGSSETLNWTIVNTAGYPLNYVVVMQSASVTKTIPNNVTPTITIAPLNGTLQPHSQFALSVTVSMPGSDKPGLTWSTLIPLIATPTNGTTPQQSAGGAVLQGGVGKLMVMHSVAPLFNPLPYEIGALAAIILIFAFGYYWLRMRKRPAVAKKTREEAKVESLLARKKELKRRHMEELRAIEAELRGKKPAARGTKRPGAKKAKRAKKKGTKRRRRRE